MCFSRYHGHFEKKKKNAIEKYFETKFFIAVQAGFRRQFQWHYLDKRLIHRWVQKFREHGTALILTAKGRRDTHSGRPRIARAPENIDTVRDSVGPKN